MVAAAGLKMFLETKLNRRNMLIIAISLGLGLGIANVPQAVAIFPEQLRVLLETGIFQAAIIAILLNVILPEPDGDR